MLNSDSDWPHGFVDAAFIIAFSSCFSPHFNICCDMQCDGEENSFPVMLMMFVARRSPTETRENGSFHIDTSSQSSAADRPRTHGSEARKCVAVVLTTLTGQGGICHREGRNMLIRP